MVALNRALKARNAIMSLRSLKRSVEAEISLYRKEGYSNGQLYYGHLESSLRAEKDLDNINRSMSENEAVLLELVGAEYVEKSRKGNFPKIVLK